MTGLISRRHKVVNLSFCSCKYVSTDIALIFSNNVMKDACLVAAPCLQGFVRALFGQ